MSIKYTIDAADAMKMFVDLTDKTKDYTPAFEKAAIQMERSVGLNFRAQGRPKWTRMSPATMKSRRKRGKGAMILQDGGTLKASVTSNIAVKKFTPLSYEYGTNLVYAAAQQFGYKHIPARPYLGFQPEDGEIIAKIFAEFIEKG